MYLVVFKKYKFRTGGSLGLRVYMAWVLISPFPVTPILCLTLLQLYSKSLLSCLSANEALTTIFYLT
jgi:hypothetical protein